MMLEDQDAAVAEESEEQAPASARATTHALRRVGAWRNEPRAEVPDPDKLSAALAHLPEEKRTKDTERVIRQALGYYLGMAHFDARPGPDVMGPHLRALATAIRSARRVLHAQPNPPAGAPVPDALAEELTRHVGALRLYRGTDAEGRQVDQVELFRHLLALTQQAAEAAAEINEALAKETPPSKRRGRPRDVRLSTLVGDLEPLWSPLRPGEREAFLADALAAVGEAATAGSLRGHINRFRERKRLTPSDRNAT